MNGNRPRRALALVILSLAASPAIRAADWPSWRGPGADGVSAETGLPSHWSPEGENLIWKVPFTGRSTPVVLDGQVCLNGRVGEGTSRQEVVACYDAGTGRKNWEHRFNVYHTAVPFNRVGWANVVGDPETGNIYVHGVAGQLIGYDRGGKILWSRFLTEELGHLSGYGGRTQTPIIDQDKLILSFVSAGWGDQAAIRHRYFAFDKRNGDLIWVATPGGIPQDLNTQSGPVAADLAGQHVIVAGDADGHVYAMSAATGETVWGFYASKRALQSTVLVHGDRVFACHSEENLDEATMGRCVAINGTGKGDVTATHEIWRANEIEAGFGSPALANGRLYVIDNSGNLRCLDAASGKLLWTHSLGTVGKSSPVLADGKIYATEVNGRFHILKLGDQAPQQLDMDELKVEDGRYAEIYGSPAVAYGRVYFSTEGGLYCIGDGSHKARSEGGPSSVLAGAVPGEGPVAAILVVPAEVAIRADETARFTVRALDGKGRLHGERPVQWTLEGLKGKIDADGRFSPADRQDFQTGTVTAQLGELKAKARVRVFPVLPWVWDFESIEAGKSPAQWVGASGRFLVAEKDGNKALFQGPVERGLDRATIFFGPSSLSGYTIEADVMGGQRGRRLPDIGLINAGYTVDLQGVHQRLEIRSWAAELGRLSQHVPFPWKPDIWYHFKARVDVAGGKASIRGKIWPRAESEPEAWTIVVEDLLPTPSGSPGLQAYHPVDVHYDNLKVTVNPR